MGEKAMDEEEGGPIGRATGELSDAGV